MAGASCPVHADDISRMGRRDVADKRSTRSGAPFLAPCPRPCIFPFPRTQPHIGLHKCVLYSMSQRQHEWRRLFGEYDGFLIDLGSSLRQHEASPRNTENMTLYRWVPLYPNMFRPHSHRTRKQICTQICLQTLWCCLQPV